MSSIRDPDLVAWRAPGAPESVRLESFRLWTRSELSRRLFWPRNPQARNWQMSRSVQVIEDFAAEMANRHYNFDGGDLATLITERLDFMAKVQRARSIDMVYAFLRRCLDRYLRIRAEEIKRLAHRLKATDFAPIPTVGAPRTMVQIVQDASRARLAEEKALKEYREGRRKTEKAQGELKLSVA